MKRNHDELVAIFALAIFSLFILLISIRPGHISFLGTSAVAGLLFALLALFRTEARPQLIFFGFFMPLAVTIFGECNQIIIDLRPHTIDATLSSLDGGLSVAIYHWTQHHPTIYLFFGFVYIALPVFTALVVGLSKQRMACFRAFVLAGLFAPIFYYLFPAIGPAYIGQVGTPRNCFPSLHLAWALELVLYSRSYLRRIAIIYLVLIAASTLGLGEHYIVDLVAAVPYTMAIYWIESQLSLHLPHLVSRRKQADNSVPVQAEMISKETELR